MTERLRLDPLLKRRVNFKLRRQESVMDATVLRSDATGYWIKGGSLADFLAQTDNPSPHPDVHFLAFAKIEWLEPHPDEEFSSPRRTRAQAVHLRPASPEDVPVLRGVIEASVRGLQVRDYTPRQVELALQTVYGVDTQLIADGTYFAAEATDVAAAERPAAAWATPGAGAGDADRERQENASGPRGLIVACGGWSKRKTLFGGDQWKGREDDLLDPAKDAAKIRAFFVRPEWARRGIGGLILDACEAAAKSAGFSRLEMGATLSGVPFYLAKGYVALENVGVPLGEGQSLPIVRMAKVI